MLPLIDAKTVISCEIYMRHLYNPLWPKSNRAEVQSFTFVCAQSVRRLFIRWYRSIKSAFSVVAKLERRVGCEHTVKLDGSTNGTKQFSSRIDPTCKTVTEADCGLLRFFSSVLRSRYVKDVFHSELSLSTNRLN